MTAQLEMFVKGAGTPGRPCPKCGQTMERRKPPADWYPVPWQLFYFSYHDYCYSCRRVQHYELAKRWLRHLLHGVDIWVASPEFEVPELGTRPPEANSNFWS